MSQKVNRTVNKLIFSCHYNLPLALSIMAPLGITEVSARYQNKEVRVTFFAAAILNILRPMRRAVTLGKSGSTTLGVKMWVKTQSVLTHITSMSTWFAAPQITDKLSPVDTFSIFRHSMENNNV